MLEIVVVAGFSYYFGAWLITKKPTAGFLAFSFFLVTFLGFVVGFLFGGMVAVALGIENSFGAAAIGAIRGAAFGLLIGGWSLIRTYRQLRKSGD